MFGLLQREKADWTTVRALMTDASIEAVEQPDLSSPYAFPGGVLLVSIGGEAVFFEAFGSRSVDPNVTKLTEGMVFDVASLTKPIVTATLVMKLIDAGRLGLDKKVSEILPNFTGRGKELITVRSILKHMSGFPATMPYYEAVREAEANEKRPLMWTPEASAIVFDEINRSRLEYLPGSKSLYSDIGFIVLGKLIETIYGESLDKIAHREIFQPLRMRSSGFVNLSELAASKLEQNFKQIVPTAYCPWRRRIMCGEVHDDNAWCMGGVAGHAGLFSTADDINRFAVELLDVHTGSSTFVSRQLLSQFWAKTGDETWVLGWDTPSPKDSSAGKYFPRDAIGHLAFTGCSIWIDPARQLVVTLLSNRIHPSTDNQLIRTFRPILHDAVIEALGFN
jgi:CubicO group peptidase (beta-lactamase class C family)